MHITTNPVKLIRSVVEAVPATEQVSAHAFQRAVVRGLEEAGCKVQREYRVADRGDGTSGFVDIVVTEPFVAGIELDRAQPRAKSIAKLKCIDGLRAVVLRRDLRVVWL